MDYFKGDLIMSRILGCVLLVLAVVSVGLAQLPTATVLGVVKDASGAVVAGATVTARNVDTGQSRSVRREQMVPIASARSRLATTKSVWNMGDFKRRFAVG